MPPELRLGVNAAIVGDRPSGLGVYTIEISRELVRHTENLLVYTSLNAIPGVPHAALRRISRCTRPERGWAGHLARLVWTQVVLARRLVRDRRSLLFSAFPEGMLLATIPQVCVVHDLIALRYPQYYPRLRYYFAHWLPWMLPRCAAVIVDSEATRRDVGALLAVRDVPMHVVYPGYDADRFRPGLDTTAVKRRYGLGRYVLFVGNLLPHKNVRGLLRAFADIASRVPHQLVIVGARDPRFLPSLTSEATRLGMMERVQWLGYVTADELPLLYGGADVYVSPSLYEGFGLTVLEAMACGVPVVSSRAGSLPEVGGNAVRWVDADMVDDMAAALYETLSDERLRATLAEAGLSRARSFSWQRAGREIFNVLSTIQPAA